ncbi:MAG: YceI family protein [Myxococcaceae bacterium]
MRALAVAALLAAVPGSAATYDLDSSHTYAHFSVKHMMVANVRGEFSKVTGSIQWDEKDVTKSSVMATIDAATIQTREDKRDAHLKSPDFLDVAKNPSLTFKSKRVEKGQAPNSLKVVGDLTIRGVTKEVPLDVTFTDKEFKDPYGNMKRGATATTKINRRDFGLMWNMPLDSGGLLVGEEVAITIEAELQRKPEAKAAAAAK